MRSTERNRELMPQGDYERLTQRDQRFVDFYVSGKSGGEAFRLSRECNKSKRSTCRVRAHRLLRRADIQAAISERSREAARLAGTQNVRVLKEAHAIGFSDVRNLVDENGDFLPLHKLDATTAAAIETLEITDVDGNGARGRRYRVKFRDKLKALDLLGQRLDLWGPHPRQVRANAKR